MKFRYTVALALIGWTLVIEPGRTAPKGCTDCAVTLEGYLAVKHGFKTKAECQKAGDDFVRDFYTNVQKTGDVVASAPGKPDCREDKSN
jgi:hypothetical protein